MTKSNKIIRLMWIVVAVPIAIVALLITLTAVGCFGRMPSFEELENPKSNLATEIYAAGGESIGSYFVQNRSYVQYEELYPQDSTAWLEIDGERLSPLAAALIATEDARYYDHSGIDFRSLARVGFKTLLLQRRSQGGGSTITQQLAKNLFPREQGSSSAIGRAAKLLTSKLKEWITAVKLEYNYTKEEIVAMYLNTVAYGSNAFGIKSAAATFFGKSPDCLSLQEAAMLIGVVNAPTRYSPVRNPERALERRNLVLRRICKAGAISQEVCDSISALPIVLNFKPVSHNFGQATYFREMLRLVMTAREPKRRNFYTKWDYEQALNEYNQNPLVGWCHKNFKADGTPYDIYRDGLKIYTTIDAKMQQDAEESLLKQMRSVIQPAMDQQVKTTKTLFNDLTPEEIDDIVRAAMRQSERFRQMKEAGVSEKDIFASFEHKTPMKVFTYTGERDTLMTPRDSILHHKRIMRASFVAIEPQTGHIKAYVGGPSFQYFKYDMARQGKRQIGSTVKPFIYTFAIDHLGLTPCTMVPNLPVTIETTIGTAWSPKEAGNVEYDGVLHPLRWGLALSRNNYSAWIMKQAKQPEAVADFIHNMGIHSFIDPVYALCLGTFESNVFELVGAYSIFANEGVYNSPLFVTHIEDRQGNIIATFSSAMQDAVSPQTAYTMVTMLKNVIKNGTGRRMGWQFSMNDVELAGKTGTSNNNRDGWFMCITPRLVAGAWVGGEHQSIHLTRRGEGSVMALPIVGEFLQRTYAREDSPISRTDTFARPVGWVESQCEDEMYQNAGRNNEEENFFE